MNDLNSTFYLQFIETMLQWKKISFMDNTFFGQDLKTINLSQFLICILITNEREGISEIRRLIRILHFIYNLLKLPNTDCSYRTCIEILMQNMLLIKYGYTIK